MGKVFRIILDKGKHKEEVVYNLGLGLVAFAYSLFMAVKYSE